MSNCLVCGKETSVCVNIEFRATPVCDRCCLAITKQTVATLTVASLAVEKGVRPTSDTRPTCGCDVTPGWRCPMHDGP